MSDLESQLEATIGCIVESASDSEYLIDGARTDPRPELLLVPLDHNRKAVETNQEWISARRVRQNIHETEKWTVVEQLTDTEIGREVY